MVQVKDKASFQKEVLEEQEKAVVVDFYADWCAPCRIMGPIVEQLEKDNKQVKVVKVNVDEVQELAMEYNVMSIPTIYVFKQGKVTKQFIGVQDQQTLEEALK